MTYKSMFTDLEIRIFSLRDEGYPVEVTLAGQQHFPRCFVSKTTLLENTTTKNLFEILFGEMGLRSAWDKARAQAERRRVRLWIDVAAQELHTLPWEALCEGTIMLAADAHTPFSRYIPLEMPWGETIDERPLRVLVVISNPNDLSKHGMASLDICQEHDVLEPVLNDIAEGQVVVEFLKPPITLARLESRLQEGYHILHYLGHGDFSQRRGQSALYLQDEAGNTSIATDVDISDMLARQGVRPRLVFLAACQSATRTTGNAFAGLALKLVAAGIPAVVAMQDKIAIKKAREFSYIFYERLAQHSIVDVAMNEARSRLLVAGRTDATVPVLFMRLKDGQIFGKIDVTEEHGPYFNIPFPHNPAFVGRSDDLQTLHTLLQADAFHRVGVCGPGGIGKTQLVIEYARRYCESYDNQVFWVDGTKELANEFAQMAVEWSLADPGDELFIKLRNIWRYLSDHPETLVVIDNLQEPSVLNQPIHPEHPKRVLAALKCRLLFTTYHYPEESKSLYASHTLATLSQVAAMDLLLHYENRRAIFNRWQAGVKDVETKAACAICELLGNLPLAVVLASAYLGKSSRRSLTTYLERLKEEGGLKTLSNTTKITRFDLATQHEPQVKATLKLQWKSIHNKMARYVFRVFGMLRNDLQIPYSSLILLTGLPGDTTLDEAIVELRELSLVEELDEGKVIRIHTLVREFAAGKTAQKKQQDFCMELAANVVQATRIDEVENEQLLEAIWCLHYVGWQDLPATERLLVLEGWKDQLSLAFFEKLKASSLEFSRGRRDFQATLSTLLDDMLALTTEAACHGMGLWAKSLTQTYQGFMEQAIVTIRSAMEIYRTVDDYRNYVLAGSNLPFMLIEQGYPQQADIDAQEIEPYLSKCDDAPAQGYLYWHWGLAKHELRKFKEAKLLLENAEPLIQTLGDPWYLASLWSAMASVYTNLEEYEKAQIYLDRAEASFGDEIGIFERGILLGYRVELYRHTDRLEVALGLAKSAVDLYQEEEFPLLDISHAVLRWVEVLIDVGEFEQALIQLKDIKDNFSNTLDSVQYKLQRSRALWELGKDTIAQSTWQDAVIECEQLSPEWVSFANFIREQSE